MTEARGFTPRFDKKEPDPTALPRLTARVNPTIHVAMPRIVRADDGWSDIVGLTLAVNLGGAALNNLFCYDKPVYPALFVCY